MIGGFIGGPIGGVISDNFSLGVDAANLAVAGQPFPVVMSTDVAVLNFTAQAPALTHPLPLAPASIEIEGQEFPFLFVVVAEGHLRFQGQDIAMQPLTPSRNRAPLKLPRPDASLTRRLASYWRGMRN